MVLHLVLCVHDKYIEKTTFNWVIIVFRGWHHEHVMGQQEKKTSWIRPNSNQSRSWILRSREVKLSARTMKTNVDKFWQWIWSYHWQVQFSAITMEEKDHKEWPVFTSCLCDKLLNHFLHPIGPALFVTMRANTFTDTFFSFFFTQPNTSQCHNSHSEWLF